ncbi:methyl-accepting chemotaxis protein [Archaeoglobus veneficus]|uniref:Methyl-accepting chemotaxis sensory transducer with Pas/Pac sensor n=1 Tax=Archaeoglobus veneficus (strain DSM 11195 / SNP6) TaxID=693661 RepID=F2KPE9_ARCVS|nr:methyl-accepting chemotaxis protein [Archaeoglobus veneficus]AEA46380.1 methyl-accepting chemotaxis sensory transducer with Pas/Pac sensor [Archaeoglobus veneficus SNP6]
MDGKGGMGLNSIRAKLLAGFGIVIALCFVIGITCYSNAVTSSDLGAKMSQKDWPAANAVMMLKALEQEKLYCVHGYLLEGDETFIEKLNEVYNEEQKHLEIIEESGAFSSDEIAELKSLNAKLDAAINDIIEAHKAGDDGKVEVIMEERLDPTSENLIGLLERMDEEIDEHMTEHTAEIYSTASKAETTALAVTVLAAVAGIGVSLFVSARISNGIKEVASVAEKIGKGDFGARATIKSGDEIGLLAESINRMGEEIQRHVSAIESMRKELVEIFKKFPRPGYVYFIDTNGVLKYANDAFVKDFTGYEKAEDIIGRRLSEVLGIKTIAEKVLETGKAVIGKEIVANKKDGTSIPLLISGIPVRANGNIIGALGFLVDITEQKRKEKEIQEIIDGVAMPLMKIDKDYNIQMINKAGAELVGKAPEEVVGRKCYEIFNTLDCRTDACACHRAMLSGRVESNETVARPMGREIPILYVATPVKNEKGEIVGAIEYITDISELKEREMRIENEKRYVEEVVNALLPVVEAAANGDLTAEIAIETRDGDALDRLVKAFEDMRSGLRSIIENLSEAVNKLSSASEELSASIEEINSASKSVSESAQKISAGAEEQTSLIEKANKLMEEISGITEETASSAESVLNIAMEAEKIAMEGVDSSNNVIRNMDSLAHANQLVTQEVDELVKKAEQIGEIVDIITKIAEQTSLLALNANIEAARVGEQGRGFAVVAGEVGKLANETQESAKSIAALIKEIQDSMHKLAESVQNSNMKTEDAVRSVSDIVEKIEKIREVIEETATGMREIKRAMDDQANAVQNLASLSDRVYQVALENAREVENTAAAAEEQASSIDEITRAAEDLSRMAEGLLKIVQRFKVE